MKIEGQIKFSIEKNEQGELITSYESTIENDIAAMAIAEHVVEVWIGNIREEKSHHTGKTKTQINDRLNKTIQTKKGLKVLTDYAFAMYEHFKKYEALRAAADAVEETAQEPLQNGNEIN